MRTVTCNLILLDDVNKNFVGRTLRSIAAESFVTSPDLNFFKIEIVLGIIATFSSFLGQMEGLARS